MKTQPAVILVHGATLNGRSWDPVRRLVDPRLHVLAPDLPGHGARRAERYTLQGGVDTVLAAARALGDAPFIVAGDSLGSYTAQAAAAALPQDRLKGLVLGGADVPGAAAAAGRGQAHRPQDSGHAARMRHVGA